MQISDAVRGGDGSPKARFKSLVTAFYIPNVLLCFSVVFFVIAAVFFTSDRNRFLAAMRKISNELCSILLETQESPSKQQAARINKAFEDLSIEVH